VRFLFHMNMASGNNDLVHQVVGEINCRSISELRTMLDSNDFITVNHVTYDRDRVTGEKKWRSRGEMILNTSHVGKAAVYYEG